MRRVRFDIGGVAIHAELLDTPTAEALWAALPIAAGVMTWGDEIYFDAGVTVDEEADARPVVEAGEIAYWPGGRAIAIGFGETPISAPGEIRLAAPCNIWARAVDDVRALASVAAGAPVSVSRA